MARKPTIAFLGPAGTFAHLAATRRFGKRNRLVARPTVRSVIDFVRQDRSRRGLVPVENSSGGSIEGTVDALVNGSTDLFIQESLSVNVKLALLGKDRKRVRVVYSHFAPLQHCEAWLEEQFPQAELREEPSTAAALRRAAEEKGAAAIGNRFAGRLYKLRVLKYPIRSEVPNVTQFFVVGHQPARSRLCSRTTIVASLLDSPGSLCDFLAPFKRERVNLSRVISRPIVGQPASYVFMVDIEGTERDGRVKRALAAARRASSGIKALGSYPVRERYES